MDVQPFWELFVDTGAPEMFLLYRKAKRMGESNVSDDQGSGDSGISL